MVKVIQVGLLLIRLKKIFNMKTLFFFVIANIAVCHVFFAQSNSYLISENVKILFYQELDREIFDSIQLNSFKELPLVIDSIGAEGFEECIFYSIKSQCLTRSVSEDGNEVSIMTPLASGFAYHVICYSFQENRIYKIAGFKSSEFLELVNGIKIYTSSLNDKKCKKNKHLDRCLKIDGLEIDKILEKYY